MTVGLLCRLDEARRAATDAREKLERQNQQLSDLEAEVGLLRRRVEQLETDRDKDKKLIAQLQESLNRARAVRIVSVGASAGRREAVAPCAAGERRQTAS